MAKQTRGPAPKNIPAPGSKPGRPPVTQRPDFAHVPAGQLRDK